jgi:protein-S-isoprenylcysteine O-methyltransferase Ste14
MGLDLRWPIGLMFSLIGVLLTITGLVTGSDADMYKRSLGTNINLVWGLVLLVFGAFMLIMAWRGYKADRAGRSSGSDTPKQ